MTLELLKSGLESVDRFLSSLWKKRYVTDILCLSLLLFEGLVVLSWFGGSNVLFFWDGYPPLNPAVDSHFFIGNVWQYWLGTGVYSPDFTQAVTYGLPYALLGHFVSVSGIQVLVYFLSFAGAGVTMFLLAKEMNPGPSRYVVALIAAQVYMFNWYWIAGVLSDLSFPTVLTLLPLLFLFYRRYLLRLENWRRLLSTEVFLAVLITLATQSYYNQAFPFTTIFLFLYTIIAAFVFSNPLRLAAVVRRLLGFLVFEAASLLTALYFVGFILTSPQDFVSFAQVYGDPLSTFQTFSSGQTAWLVLRDLQVALLNALPYANVGLFQFVQNPPVWFLILSSLPLAFVFIGLLSRSGSPIQRSETLGLSAVLAVVLYVSMGWAAPYSGGLTFVLTHYWFGSILINPILTVGFLVPFLTAILVANGARALLALRSETTAAHGAPADTNIQSRIPLSWSDRWKYRRRTLVESFSRYLIPAILAALMVSPVLVAFPLVGGTAVPTFNSGNTAALGPQIPSRVSIPSNVSAVMDRVGAIVGTQRMIELPLQSGDTSMTSPAKFVSALDYLQLLSGTDSISSYTYGIGPQTSLLFTEINEIIFDNYYYGAGNWSTQQTFGVPTQNFCGLLSTLDAPYILVVPNIPNLSINSVSPYVNYSMVVRFLQHESNVTLLFSQDNFQLYQCGFNFSPITAAIPVETSTPATDSIVANGVSSVPWAAFYAGMVSSTPVPFLDGVSLRFNGNPEIVTVGPPVSLNVSTAAYRYLQMDMQPVNSTLSFDYVYSPNRSSVGQSQGVLPLFSGTLNHAYQIAAQGVALLTFSTRIPTLPGSGTGQVPHFESMYIGVTPLPNLPLGSVFGFRMTNLTFTEQTSAPDVVAYSLTQNPRLAFVPAGPSKIPTGGAGWALPADLATDVTSPTSLTVHVIGAHGSFLLLLSDTYVPQWRADVENGPSGGGVESGHVVANTFENAWYINGSGNFTIEVSFPPQGLVPAFAVVTLVAVALEAGWIILATVRQRRGPG